MSATIVNAHIEQFKQNVIVRAQQRGSRLRGCVTTETVTGAVHNFERIGASNDQEKVTQYEDTPNSAIEHDRRQVVLRDWHWAKMIDRSDTYKTLIDISGKYTQAGMYGVGRRWDNLILAAAFGNAQAKVPGANKGEYTLTNVAFDANNVVPNTVGAGTTMNYEKLLAAKEILLSSDVDEDFDKITLALNSYQLHELLKDEKLTSADYNTVQALVAGKIDTFLGMNFIRTEQISATATDDEAAVFCQSGIGLAVGRDLTAKHSERDDKSYSHQVYLEHACEAVRLEEEKVVKIETTVKP